jgi:hypothetical protein
MPPASTRLTIGGLVKLLLTTDREPLTLQPTLEELILVHYGLRSNGAWNIELFRFWTGLGPLPGGRRGYRVGKFYLPRC